MEELIETMNRLIEQNADQSKVQAEQAKVLAELLAKQVAAPVVHVEGGGAHAAAAPGPVVARKSPEEILRDKISLLHQLLTKSPKVKDYRSTNDQPIKEWLINFEDALTLEW